MAMDPLRLTRQLVDIESLTGNEAEVGEFLLRELRSQSWQTEPMPVEGRRFNLYAGTGRPPALVFSTHMDTVPPFFPSSEDEHNIYGRGSCDAKGILAAQVAAAERLRQQDLAVGLLFVVGEEVDSAGAKVANTQAKNSRFLINGEPTDNRLATLTKGSLGVELVAEGRAAHSAFPELGESAIEKLLEAIARIKQVPLPSEGEAGPSYLNVGVIEGGRAPNVIPDQARARLLFRLAGPAGDLKQQVQQVVGNLARVHFFTETPFLRLRTVDGFPTMVAPFTTDIPKLTNWGQPLLLGPGSVHVAHTEREHIAKKELLQAVELYVRLSHVLLAG